MVFPPIYFISTTCCFSNPQKLEYFHNYPLKLKNKFLKSRFSSLRILPISNVYALSKNKIPGDISDISFSNETQSTMKEADPSWAMISYNLFDLLHQKFDNYNISHSIMKIKKREKLAIKIIINRDVEIWTTQFVKFFGKRRRPKYHWIGLKAMYNYTMTSLLCISFVFMTTNMLSYQFYYPIRFILRYFLPFGGLMIIILTVATIGPSKEKVFPQHYPENFIEFVRTETFASPTKSEFS